MASGAMSEFLSLAGPSFHVFTKGCICWPQCSHIFFVVVVLTRDHLPFCSACTHDFSMAGNHLWHWGSLTAKFTAIISEVTDSSNSRAARATRGTVRVEHMTICSKPEIQNPCIIISPSYMRPKNNLLNSFIYHPNISSHIPISI